MAEKNPRISFMVEKPVYQAIQYLATTEGVSVSTIVRDLLKEALQLREDLALAEVKAKDIAKLDNTIKQRIKKAIETKLQTAPQNSDSLVKWVLTKTL